MVKTINILGVDYELHYVDSISRDSLRIGEIDYLQQKILILNDLGMDLERVTILHEVVHGILSQLGFEEENNEHLTQSLASALHQVLKDNPSIRQY